MLLQLSAAKIAQQYRLGCPAAHILGKSILQCGALRSHCHRNLRLLGSFREMTVDRFAVLTAAGHGANNQWSRTVLVEKYRRTVHFAH